MEEVIGFLKETLTESGHEWMADHRNKDKMRDCVALVEAVNALEERVYGKSITTISYVL